MASAETKRFLGDFEKAVEARCDALFEELLADPFPDNLDTFGELAEQGVLVTEDERYHEGFADGCRFAQKIAIKLLKNYELRLKNG